MLKNESTKEALWTPENIWLLLQHSTAYEAEVHTFETSARKQRNKGGDLPLKLIEAIRKGKFAEDLLLEQDFSQARWQRFLRKYSDVLRAPVPPSVDFNSSIAPLIIAAPPMREIPFHQAPAFIKSLLHDDAEPDLSKPDEIMARLKRLEVLDPYILAQISESQRAVLRKTINQLKALLRKKKRTDTTSIRTANEVLLPLCLVIDKGRDTDEVVAEVEQHLRQALGKVKRPYPSHVETKITHKRLKMGLEALKKFEAEELPTHEEVVHWIESKDEYRDQLQGIGDRKAMVQNLFSDIRKFLGYFDR